MEDFASILVRDYGLKPQGKSAPMSSTKVSPGVGSSRASSYGSDRKGSVSGRMSGNASTFSGQEDVPYLSRKNGSTKMSGRSTYGGDDLFSPGNYDDVFGGPPKSNSAGPRYDDVFGETSDSGRAPVYDDLFGGLGVNEPKGKVSSPRVGSPGRSDRSNFAASDSADFDELLPGFSSEPAKSRSSGDAVASHDANPFVPPLIDDPLITTPNNSNSAPFIDPIDPMDVFTVPPVPPINTTTDAPRASNNASVAFDGFDIFDGYTNQSSTDASKPRETSQSLRDDLRKSVEDLNSNHSTGLREQSPTDETEPSERDIPAVEPTEAYNIASKAAFFSYDGVDAAASSVSSSKRGDDPLFSSPLDSPVPFKARSRSSPFGDVKEKWLTVNDVKLVTKPTSVPPPSRPPPVPGSGKYGSRSRVDHMESGGQEDRFMSSSWPSANTASAAFGNSSEEEQTGGGTPGGSRKDFFGRMDSKTNASNQTGDDEKDVEEDAAAIKAREKEKQEKERQEREAKEAEVREEREKERVRRYREKEREREKDRAAVQRVTMEARERAAHEARDRAERSAVERVTAEARQRAAQQAQERATRERAAVEKAHAEARERAQQRAAMERAAKERADRAAAERAAAERAERLAAERLAAEKAAERIALERAQQQEERQKAEKAALEAKHRAVAEARERAEREREKAQRERERADKEAAEKAARREKEQLRRSEHDLDAFFNPGLHTAPQSSEPKRSASVNNMSNMSNTSNTNFDPNGIRRSTNNNSRPSSVPSADYLRSLFEDPVPQPTSNSGEDPARNKRSGAADRSRDRAVKALEEIKKREAEMQREQAEKYRAADQLDAEIKRWAAGKEGNLRALLSTLQYVLWPECGWQPVSLSDLITAASVKKTYRKATLFVHPDKVQQKGATVQQKYIAEKVFDLLKEASNKFNSEELF